MADRSLSWQLDFWTYVHILGLGPRLKVCGTVVQDSTFTKEHPRTANTGGQQWCLRLRKTISRLELLHLGHGVSCKITFILLEGDIILSSSVALNTCGKTLLNKQRNGNPLPFRKKQNQASKSEHSGAREPRL